MPAAAAPTDDGNGKVTLAVINNKIDNIIEKLNEACAKTDGHDYRLRSLEAGQVERKIQIDTIKLDVRDLEAKSEKLVDALDSKSSRWSLINTLGAAVAAIIGAVGLSR